jgi:hypothetical protein
LAADLFEVIAELAGLDLEQGPQAQEAIDLATAARRRLVVLPPAEDFAYEPSGQRERDGG